MIRQISAGSIVELMKHVNVEGIPAADDPHGGLIVMTLAEYHNLRANGELLSPESTVVAKKEKALNVMTAIERYVSDTFGVSVEMLRSGDRSHEVCHPRHIFFYLCHHVGLEKKPTGRYMGGKDHSTVCNAVKVINNRIDTELHIRRSMALHVQNVVKMLEELRLITVNNGQ